MALLSNTSDIDRVGSIVRRCLLLELKEISIALRCEKFNYGESIGVKIEQRMMIIT